MSYSINLPYSIPSQNTRDAQHWSKRNRDTKRAESMLRVLSRGIPKASTKRIVHVTSYRKQRCRDDSNLRGGAKGLLDAIVRCGLLLDDSDKLASISYEQFTLSQMPPDLANKYNGRPCTVVTLEDAPCL